MTPLRATVIINPIAGSGRATRIGACADLARSSLSRHGFDADVRVTAGPADAPASASPPASAGTPADALRALKLPEIAGLDARAGLRRAGGKVPLYLSLLARFARDFAAFEAACSQLVATGQWDAAERQAHTLKGLVASLGAADVQPGAARLEHAARVRSRADADLALAEIGAVLPPLLEALRTQLPPTEADPHKAPVEMADKTAADRPAGAAAWLGQLRRLLRDGSDRRQ